MILAIYYFNALAPQLVRIIADLVDDPEIKSEYLAEALQYRQAERIRLGKISLLAFRI